MNAGLRHLACITVLLAATGCTKSAATTKTAPRKPAKTAPAKPGKTTPAKPGGRRAMAPPRSGGGRATPPTQASRPGTPSTELGGGKVTPPAIGKVTPPPAIGKVTPLPAIGKVTPPPAIGKVTPPPVTQQAPAVCIGPSWFASLNVQPNRVEDICAGKAPAAAATACKVSSDAELVSILSALSEVEGRAGALAINEASEGDVRYFARLMSFSEGRASEEHGGTFQRLGLSSEDTPMIRALHDGYGILLADFEKARGNGFDRVFLSKEIMLHYQEMALLNELAPQAKDAGVHCQVSKMLTVDAIQLDAACHAWSLLPPEKAPQQNVTQNLLPPPQRAQPPRQNVLPPQQNVQPPRQNVQPPKGNAQPPQQNVHPGAPTQAPTRAATQAPTQAPKQERTQESRQARR